MRAVEISLFFICISVGVSTVGALDIFPDVGPHGSSASDINPAINPSEGVPSLSNFLGIGILGGFVISAITARLLGADPLRVIGIGLFGAFFWGLWGTANSILSWFDLGPLQAVILMVYAITFFIAIQELCSQTNITYFG